MSNYERWTIELSNSNGVRTYEYAPYGKKEYYATEYDIEGEGKLTYYRYYWKPFLLRRRLRKDALEVDPGVMHRLVADAGAGELDRKMFLQFRYVYPLGRLTLTFEEYRTRDTYADWRADERQYKKLRRLPLERYWFKWLYPAGQDVIRDFEHLCELGAEKTVKAHNTSTAEYRNTELFNALCKAEEQKRLTERQERLHY